MLFTELSREVRSDGGLGDIVAIESVDVDAAELEGSVDAFSMSLSSCAGGTGGFPCKSSSMVSDSAICLCSPRLRTPAQRLCQAAQNVICVVFNNQEERRQCDGSV
jgi:hypothetical protein